MKRVYLALPTADAVAIAIRKRLKRKKSAKRLKVVGDLEAAQVVVTSTADIKSLPKRLPPKVNLECFGQHVWPVPGNEERAEYSGKRRGFVMHNGSKDSVKGT